MTDSENDLTAAVERAVPADLPPYSAVLARRDRRRNRRRAVLASAGAAALVAAVLGGTAMLGGDEPAGLPSADRSSNPPVTPSQTSDGAIPDVAPEWNGKTPPPVVLQLDGREVRLRPWTSCFSYPPDDSGVSQGQCSDGFAQPPFEDAGDRASVPFSFPVKQWSFEATFKASGGDDCARTFTVPVRKTGDYTFEIPPAGPPGSYDVDLFGRGPEGDVITTFAWTTSEAGELPEPTAAVAFLTDEDDDVVSYGMELTVTGLANTPREATAKLVVTGRRGSFEVVGPVDLKSSCGEGTLSFSENRDGPEPFLGRAPFRYRLELTLDGTTYVGTAAWPRDENDEPPYTDLTFTPPLPAFTGSR